jgi:hypothetical protein
VYVVGEARLADRFALNVRNGYLNASTLLRGMTLNPGAYVVYKILRYVYAL